MNKKVRKSKNSVVVTATTYPRWRNDTVAPFIQEFCSHVAPYFKKLYVLAPHYAGAKQQEQQDNILVRRFRYMIPAKAQDIVYGGGGVFKIKKTPVYAVKLCCFALSELIGTLRLAFKDDVKIINAHWIVPQGFLAILVKFITRKKIVVSAHGADVYALKGGFMTSLKRFTLKHADAVVVNSSATKEACQAVYPALEAQVIPMGIDMEMFSPAPKPEDLMKKYDLNGKFTILFTGRLTKVKGVIYLLQALTMLKDKNPNFKALIIGDGPDKPKLVAYAAEHGLEDNVVFMGWVDKAELPQYYHVADVMVGLSLHEALGIVFIEAQACGVPVIASRVGGIVDTVVDNETGFLVDVKSPDQAYERLLQLSTDANLQKKMSHAAAKVISEHFSWDNVALRYKEVFDKLR